MPNIILISGGFDPIHSGHIKLIQEANKYGDVVVLLNSDTWLRNKKGKEFLPFEERKIIMKNIKGVLDVIEFDDSDKTCVRGIQKAKSLSTRKGRSAGNAKVSTIKSPLISLELFGPNN